MDQIEEVSPEFVQYKNEQCIQIRFRDGIRDGRVVLTNPVSSLREIFRQMLFCRVYFRKYVHIFHAIGMHLAVESKSA